MKIIEPSAELIDNINPAEILAKIERCGRVCYQSQPKGDPESFVRMLIKRGHESVLEHVSLTFHIICDRAIMAELTCHRHASFTVESTRYVEYDEIEVIDQDWTDYYGGNEIECFFSVLDCIERDYKKALSFNVHQEDARAVLPLCLKSELYMTANLRELRHILKLCTSKHAHPQMHFVAGQILNILRDKLPVIVEDMKEAE